jgi:hypothetical protein
MAKNSNIEILRRCQEMDRILSLGGSSRGEFAQSGKITEKTVDRNLEAFRQLGQKIDKHWDWETGFSFRYAKGVRPIFTENLQYVDWLSTEREWFAKLVHEWCRLNGKELVDKRKK